MPSYYDERTGTLVISFPVLPERVMVHTGRHMRDVYGHDSFMFLPTDRTKRATKKGKQHERE